ncbi:hypothetical protein NP233_g4669 [Leucocoprinus birnbaumii]|uniref:GH16 domain-containing protein n=1 Tax=Leucocoprinus birnbaumii TaxID=56174 RepID=A0AAD5YXE7_9AGAR|nr:hypothetical protein NP233_g4669 [Leucocoprinus birnbaumii]
MMRLANLLDFVCILLWAGLSGNLFILASYVPVREYAGPNFFDAWTYWDNVDNTTWGNVTYVDRQTATSSRLAYVNDAGNAIIKVDNTTLISPAPLVNRNSVRITSQDTYGVGNLIVIDVRHIPYGCSTWPSFWTLGTEIEWPNSGEIDIIEGINMLTHNQMALHTIGGCFQAANPGQTGQTIEGDCSKPQGCLVAETKPNSWGQAFAQAGGGVWALQLDVSGIYIWFWSRPDVPPGISSATNTSTLDTTTWGMPSASYPASGCNITQFFTPQQLVIDITLCGVWLLSQTNRAGVPSIYASTCQTPTMSCVADNIIGSGSPAYDNAFWEISWIRAYTNNPAAAPPPPQTTSSLSTQAPALPTSTTTLFVTGSREPTSVIEPTQTPSAAQSTNAFSSTTRLLSIPLCLAIGTLVF